MNFGPFLRRWHETLTRQGAAPAIVRADNGDAITFAELDERAREIAAKLSRKNTRGRLTLLHLPNGPEWPVVFLGLHIAGAIVVPVDAETPEKTVESLAGEIKAAGVYGSHGYKSTGCRPRRKKQALFLGKLTSGSTGKPGLHLFTEEQMLADADAIRKGMGLNTRDINHAGLPFSHSYALGNIILPLFAHGMPMVVASSHFPGVIAAEIRRHRATVLPTVPSIISALAGSSVNAADLDSIRLVISAGARLSPESARDFALKFGKKVHNFYGSSETGGIAYDESGDACENGTIGTPLPGVFVRRMRDGRLVVKSPAVRTFANRRTDAGLGEQVMGDIGHLLPDGRISLERRATSPVKIGGRRINIGEIESRLRAYPGIRDAIVCPTPGKSGDPRLAAIIAGDSPDTAKIKTHLRKHLAEWSVPSRMIVLKDFPVNARGKPDRNALLRLVDTE